ncbi:YlqD family protein [Bacillus massilinigeriensis]|uniref:YlqD family protein n=1 Tax=Bacillus massilionigeriensis TaxID=1805475 RepID=UPI00096AF0BF|nr:YlqD family protein [Bacillus massilionigeriensis]
MKILQSVIVKQVLTEKSKEELLRRLTNDKSQYQKECDQLRFEMKKLEKANKLQRTKIDQHFEKEIQHRLEKIQLVDFQIEQLHMLPLGSELKEKEVQAILEIKEGDCWDDINEKTIVIKDGMVVEIR